MSAHNRVIWSEGLFLQPQHFQQQERYFERYVEARCHSLVPHSWGFTEIEFERDFLSIGKVGAAARGRRVSRRHALSACRTTIRCRSRSTSDPTSAIRSCISPCRCAGRASSRPTAKPGADELVRHDVREVQARNDAVERRRRGAARGRGACARGCCWRATSPRPTRACRSPTWSNAGRTSRSCSTRASSRRSCTCGRRGRLAAFTTELLGLLHQRGEALAGRVAATGRGAAAEFADFLMLQAINRYEPLLAHYAESGSFIPRTCFRSACRRRASWRPSRRPRSGRPKIPAYRHDRLRESFDPVIAALRESLSKVLMQSAISIPIEPKKFGISVAIVGDRSLYSTAVFILAARADLAVRGAAAPVPGAAQDRSGRRRSPIWCRLAAARRAGARGAGRAATDSVSRRVRLFRARSNRCDCGSSSRAPAGSGCTSRASSPGWRWSSGRSAADSGLTHGEQRRSLPSTGRDEDAAAARSGQAHLRRCRPAAGRRPGAVVRRRADSDVGARAARHRIEPARAGGESAAAPDGPDARDALADGRAGPPASRPRGDSPVRGAGARVRRAERGRPVRALYAVRGPRRGGARRRPGAIRANGRSIRCWWRCIARRGAARSSSRCWTGSRRIRPATSISWSCSTSVSPSASPASTRCRSAGTSTSSRVQQDLYRKIRQSSRPDRGRRCRCAGADWRIGAIRSCATCRGGSSARRRCRSSPSRSRRTMRASRAPRPRCRRELARVGLEDFSPPQAAFRCAGRR